MTRLPPWFRRHGFFLLLPVMGIVLALNIIWTENSRARILATVHPGMVLNVSGTGLNAEAYERNPIDLLVVRVPTGCSKGILQEGLHLSHLSGPVVVVGQARKLRKRYLLKIACGAEFLADPSSMINLLAMDAREELQEPEVPVPALSKTQARARTSANLAADEAASVPTP